MTIDRRGALMEPYRRLAACLAIGLLMTLAGCKTDLFTKRTEGEVNQMVAALLERGIPAEKKTPDSGKTWTVVVDEDMVVQSLAVLRANGLPQETHVSLGDLFKKEGMISTPTEERVRFIHGVSQELSSTLSSIDGVVVAKVHIVLPNNDPMAETVKPASASVFVKYRPQSDLTSLTPSIKNLVARSVEGLTYDNVTVTLVPGSEAPLQTAPAKAIPWGWIAPLVLIGLLFVGTLVLLLKPSWLPPKLAERLRRLQGSTASQAA